MIFVGVILIAHVNGTLSGVNYFLVKKVGFYSLSE